MRLSRLLVVALAVLIFAGGFISGQVLGQKGSTTEDEIRAVMDRYLVARNTFNADAFMSFFIKSPQLTVVSATSEYAGWDGLRKGIAPLFEGRSSTVDITDVRVFQVATNVAVVQHHYSLKTARGTANPSRSTKVFYKTAEGWKVIAEHSSRTPNFVSR